MAVTDSTPIGARFGRLTVSGAPFKKEGKQHHYHVLCKCDCGSEKIVQCYNIVKGYTSSCGCEHRDMLLKRNTTHGKYGTGAHLSWRSMLARCLNQNEPGYDNYGGRGIKVCNRWLEFANFFADMGERPSRMSLDRINVNGNYEPGNCRWATDREQSNNTRSNVYLDHDGRRMTVSQWAAEVGLNANAIYARLKRGWSAEESLTTAPRKTSRTAG